MGGGGEGYHLPWIPNIWVLSGKIIFPGIGRRENGPFLLLPGLISAAVRDSRAAGVPCPSSPPSSVPVSPVGWEPRGFQGRYHRKRRWFYNPNGRLLLSDL